MTDCEVENAMQGEGLPDVAGPTALLLRYADGSALKRQAVQPFNNAELPGKQLLSFLRSITCSRHFCNNSQFVQVILSLHCTLGSAIKHENTSL